MSDSYSLKIMSLFEAGARLKCNSETVCLAANIYHRFFKTRNRIWDYDLYMFACASIKLALKFYEIDISDEMIVLSMMSVIHGNKFYIEPQLKHKLNNSVDFASKIICINLDYEVDYKNIRRMTPGEIAKSKMRADNIKALIAQHDDDSDNELEGETYEERLLLNNSKQSISGQRYLVHYLKCIKWLLKPHNEADFLKICNVAWTLLADFHWSDEAIKHFSEHIACTSFMMAIKICLKTIKDKNFQNLLDKKWNLIFCEDYSNQQAHATEKAIVKQYMEYDRVMAHEFNTYVIDPKKNQ